MYSESGLIGINNASDAWANKKLPTAPYKGAVSSGIGAQARSQQNVKIAHDNHYKRYKEYKKKYGNFLVENLTTREIHLVLYGYNYAKANKMPASKDVGFSVENVARYFKTNDGPLWDAGYRLKDFNNFNPPPTKKSGINAVFHGINTMIRKEPLKAVAIVAASVATAGAASAAYAGAVAAAGTATAGTVTLATGIEAAKQIKKTVDDVKKVAATAQNIKAAVTAQPTQVKAAPLVKQAPIAQQTKAIEQPQKTPATAPIVIGSILAKLLIF